jgi:transposase
LASISAPSIAGGVVLAAASRLRSGLAERPRSGRPPKLAPTRYAEVRALILAYPDATLPEHAARLETTTGIRLSPSHLSRVVRRLGLRLKKRA